MTDLLRHSIASRTSAIGCIALLAVLASITVALTTVITERSRQQRVEWLHDRAEGVAAAIDGVDMTTRTFVEHAFPVLSAMVGRSFALKDSSGVLLADGTALNGNFEAVDRFTAQTGAVATIFAKQGDSFKRIATSVRKEDGTRAVGTLLDPNGRPYSAVAAGGTYTGRATLFGKPYMTHYAAVRDSANKVVGVLFIGFEIAAFDAAIEDIVRQGRFFDSGGIFVIDPRTGFDDAVFAVHPNAKGKKVLQSFATAKPFLTTLAAGGKGAVPSPGLFSTAGGDRWATMSVSRSTGLWVVAEVSDAEAMRSHWQALIPFWALLGLACVVLSGGLLWMMNRQVGSPLRELSDAAKAVAAGKLSRSFTSDRRDEIGQVIRDVDAMRVRFLSLLTTVRSSAESITTASSEIAAGNGDLSARTQQSAAGLETTASSVEQLTRTVTQTAEAAAIADKRAAATLAAGTRGTEAVQAVVNVMDEINASARQIADITSLIDGIAFQTRLLALNAAVEAARAGDQGRGFAVVATEVRSLAQRSIDAAKDIKALIGRSAAKVDGGLQLAASAGVAMTEIQAEVRRVTEIIGGISHAASEQAAGISQVNTAVGQLDKSTQQNAALVEQSAAAAESLKDQAVRLTAILGTFDLRVGPEHDPAR